MRPRAIGTGWALLAAACAACAGDARLPPPFPRDAAEAPFVQEQALLALAADGSAAVAELVLAEGAPARLELLELDRGGRVAARLLRAPPDVARAVAARLVEAGARREPLLEGAVAAAWPEALQRARADGSAAAPAMPPSADGSAAVPPVAQSADGSRDLPVEGAAPARLRLLLRLAEAQGPRAQALWLSEAPGADASASVPVASMPLSGEAVPPRIFLAPGTAWMLSGSVRGGTSGEPLRRTVGLRAADLRAAEAELHDQRGAASLSRGDLAGAGRGFRLALAADPSSVPALYHAARLAAREGRADDAVSDLRAAAAADLRLLQALLRPDDELAPLRSRADVRAILGLAPSGAGAPPP